MKGWFADIDEDAREGWQWQPCLETGEGYIPSIGIWFKAEQECEEWIRKNILGAGMLEEVP